MFMEMFIKKKYSGVALNQAVISFVLAVLMMFSLVVSGETLVIFSDDFESEKLLSGEWINTRSGTLKVNGFAANNGKYGVRLNRGAGLETLINTEGFSSLELSYARRTSNLTQGQNLTVEWSHDRNLWNQLEQIESSEWQHKVFKIEIEKSEEFYLRFALNSLKNKEQAHVDDVIVKGYM